MALSKRRRSSPKPPKKQPAAVRRPVGVRIIGGRLRGRKIRYTGQWLTRPMKDRVRQAVFNILGQDVVDKWAIDLFAGTGALGIEALSRGACRATLIEQHVPTAETIRQNLAELGLLEQAEVVVGSAIAWAQRACSARQSPKDTATPWLVFCSPPWEYFLDRRDEMLGLLQGLIEAAPAESVFVAEWDKRFEYRRLPDFQHWDIRAYPPAFIGVYIKRAAQEEAGSLGNSVRLTNTETNNETVCD